jgi:hypothetical protein
MKRYLNLYDQAAKGYSQACQGGLSSERRMWKKRLQWLDRKLTESGELYLEKEVF